MTEHSGSGDDEPPRADGERQRRARRRARRPARARAHASSRSPSTNRPCTISSTPKAPTRTATALRHQPGADAGELPEGQTEAAGIADDGKPDEEQAAGEVERRLQDAPRLGRDSRASQPCSPSRARPRSRRNAGVVGFAGRRRAAYLSPTAASTRARRTAIGRNAPSGAMVYADRPAVGGVRRSCAWRRMRATWSGVRPVPSRIWWRQEKPSAAMTASAAALRTAGSSEARPSPARPRGYRRHSRRRRPCRSSSTPRSRPRALDQRQRLPTAPMAPNAFWWQWPCSSTLPRRPAIGRAMRPAAASRGEELLEQQGCAASRSVSAPGSMERNSSRSVSRQDGSSPTMGMPRSTSGRGRGEHAAGLGARLLDQTGGQERAAAAQRPAAVGRAERQRRDSRAASAPRRRRAGSRARSRC